MGLLATLTAGWAPDLRGYEALAAVFFFGSLLPIIRTPLVIASGLIFGLLAVPVVSLASTAGSAAAFLLGRHLVQDSVRRALIRWRLSAAVLRAVDLEGWRVVALMRFWGPLPTTIQSYAFAITRVPLWSYTMATLVFSLPQIAFYCYLGSLGQQALRGEFPGYVSALTAATACICALLVVTVVGHRVRSILRKAGASEADLAETRTVLS